MSLGQLRSRADLVFDWAVAAAFLAATFVVTFLLVRELRRPNPVQPPPARAAAVQPAVLPASAVGVPSLMLLDGKTIRVGETASAVVALFGGAVETRSEPMGRGPLGPKVAKYYEQAGTRFILVFEPFEINGEPRVAAIYLH